MFLSVCLEINQEPPRKLLGLKEIYLTLRLQLKVECIASTSKRAQVRKKQHATLLTTTSFINILEEKENKRKAKKCKTEIRIKKNIKKANDSQKAKAKSCKRKVLQESSSETESEDNICDNDDMDQDDENYNKCNICEEFGKNNELCYRCTTCGLWSHVMCSGWNSAEGDICDFCAKY